MSKTVIDMAQSVGATRYTNRHYPDRPTYTFFVDQLECLVELTRADERAKLAEQPAPAAQPAQYPEGDVVGPCVCGSWPGGKCLKCPRIKRPAQQWPMTDEMVTAAARALNKRQAEACCVDKNDHWKFYGDDIKEDARAVLEAAHGITKGNT